MEYNHRTLTGNTHINVVYLSVCDILKFNINKKIGHMVTKTYVRNKPRHPLQDTSVSGRVTECVSLMSY